MNPAIIEITITSDVCHLPIVRGAVERMGPFSGLTESDIHSLAWAVDEALANVIKHGYEGRAGEAIHMSFTAVNSADGRPGVVVEIRDKGRQVQPCTIQSRNLDDVRPGGLGVYIIQTVMDQYDYSCPEGGGMLLRMVKYRSGVPEAPCCGHAQDSAAAHSACRPT